VVSDRSPREKPLRGTGTTGGELAGDRLREGGGFDGGELRWSGACKGMTGRATEEAALYGDRSGSGWPEDGAALYGKRTTEQRTTDLAANPPEAKRRWRTVEGRQPPREKPLGGKGMGTTGTGASGGEREREPRRQIRERDFREREGLGSWRQRAKWKFETPSIRFSSSMNENRKKNNKILLPRWRVVKEKCIHHFSFIYLLF